MQNLLDELKTLLATQPRFTQEGRMIKQAVIDAAQSLDLELLQLLISHEAIKRHFFQDVGGVLVFDKVKLLRFVSNKAFLEDSYTAFKNKIGLVTKNSDGLYDAYLSDSKEVVLAHPYKDCMLEGGQTKEEEARKEIFWNETLAPDDIDRLKEPKAFSNIKRYDTEGAHENITDLSLNDNFIIKGNNLLALYSLLPVYRGKVKLIYIDPPYNTGNDSFRYNDSFNHSTWLTFMKDRLKVARELLSNDGSIWINIDDDEAHYLKVVCDEIFNRSNFLASIVWQHSVQGKGYTSNFSLHHNYILGYKKSEDYQLGLLDRTDEHNLNYSNPDNDPKGLWRTGDIRNALYRKNLIYDIETPNGNIIKAPEKGWRFSKETMFDKIKTGQVYFNKEETRAILKIYLKDQEGRVPETIWLGKDVGTTREGNSEIKELFNEKVFETPKPERLLSQIIHINSDENDLILDFHLGSGTTAAVAHKMGRRYIGVEQLDYVEKIVVERLEKVMTGEQGGISKSVNWQGGGSFIYMELAKANQHFVEQIQSAKTEAELLEIWERMQAEAFISYKVTPDMIDKNQKEYEALSMEDKRRFLIECLDKNLLYVPHCDMESKEFGMSKTDKKATTAFYNLKNQA